MPATPWAIGAMWQQDFAAYTALTFYFGLLAGLFLYNLLLFLSVREAVYIAYCAFVAAMGVALAALTGFGAQFLWRDWTWWTAWSPVICLAAAAVSGIVFVRSFLSTAQRMPRMDAFLLAQIAGWLLSIAAAAALPSIAAEYVVGALGATMVPTMLWIGVVAVRREFAGARYFLLAWAVLPLAVAMFALHVSGALHPNPVTAHALPIGSALQALLLSFALGDRINVARRFKEAAQARIAAEHAMVEALSQSQNHLRMVLEEREIILQNSIVGIAFLTSDGRLRWANKAVMDLFGVQARPGLSMERFYESREQYIEVGGGVAAAAAKGQVFERELQMRRADGTSIWVSLSGKAVSSDDLSKGTVWVLMDISGRKALEAELQRASSEREALAELRSRFVAMTSHEFRTPLAAIMSAEELLRHYGDRLAKAERDEILDSIASGVQRMSRMMDRVLLLGKADAGMLEFQPQRIRLAPLVKQFVDEARALQPDDPSEVKLHIADDVHEGTYDERLLRHIFSNLLSNALKYSPGGGEVHFHVRREDSKTVFEVADQGIGIPADEISHLFESFHRASNVGAIQGTGLGLAIVKNAVERHGGEIEVQSKVGEGTMFRVSLPS